jgi:hypothetical protein
MKKKTKKRKSASGSQKRSKGLSLKWLESLYSNVESSHPEDEVLVFASGSSQGASLFNSRNPDAHDLPSILDGIMLT